MFKKWWKKEKTKKVRTVIPKLPEYLLRCGAFSSSMKEHTFFIDKLRVTCESYSGPKCQTTYRLCESGANIEIYQWDGDDYLRVSINGEKLENGTDLHAQVLKGVSGVFDKIEEYAEKQKEREALRAKREDKQKIEDIRNLVAALFPDFTNIEDVGLLGEHLLSDNPRARKAAKDRLEELK